MARKTLCETERLAVYDEDRWHYVERKNATGVVIMVAVTDATELLLVEQYRTPVHARVLELPAGIVGDVDASESLESAAKRELLEETGYAAAKATPLFTGSVSPGLVGRCYRSTAWKASPANMTGAGSRMKTSPCIA